MTEIELYYDGSTSVEHVDAEAVVPATAAVELLDPEGASLATPAVTIDSYAGVVGAGSTTLAIVVDDATGLVRGRQLSLLSRGVRYLVTVERVDFAAGDDTIHLPTALPAAPQSGDTLTGLRMTATVAAQGSAQVGTGFRLVWTYTGSDGIARRVGYPAAVVRWPWTPLVSAQSVLEVMSRTFGQTRALVWCQNVADLANDKARSAIHATGRRPWLFLSSASFSGVVDTLIKYALAEEGVCLGGQVYEAQQKLRWAFNDDLANVLKNTPGYDANEDGKLTGTEKKPLVHTIRTRR